MIICGLSRTVVTEIIIPLNHEPVMDLGDFGFPKLFQSIGDDVANRSE